MSRRDETVIEDRPAAPAPIAHVAKASFAWLFALIALLLAIAGVIVASGK